MKRLWLSSLLGPPATQWLSHARRAEITVTQWLCPARSGEKSLAYRRGVAKIKFRFSKKKLLWPHPRLSDFLLHLFPRKVMKIQVIGFHRDLVTFSRTSWPQKMSIRSETSSKQLFTEKWFFKNAPVTWWLIPARYAHKKKEIGRGAREKNYKNIHKVHKDLGNEEMFTLHFKKNENNVQPKNWKTRCFKKNYIKKVFQNLLKQHYSKITRHKNTET